MYVTDDFVHSTDEMYVTPAVNVYVWKRHMFVLRLFHLRKYSVT